MLQAVLRLSSRCWHINLARSLTTQSTLQSCSGPRYRMPSDRNQLCVQKLHTSALLNKREHKLLTKLPSAFNAFKIFVENNETLEMSDDDWAKLREELRHEDPSFKDGMDYKLIMFISSRPELALSLRNYLESIHELNFVARSEFMYSCCEVYEDVVLKDLDQLLHDKNIYQSLTARAFDAVLKTKEWKKGIIFYNLWKENETMFSKRVIRAACKIGLAAINHRDYAIASQYLNKYCDEVEANVYEVSNEIFNRFITRQISFDVFLELLKMPNLYLTREQSLKLKDIFVR